MGTEILAGPLGEGRVASTAGGGTALTTTAAFIRLPRVTSHIALTPRNFATAVVAKYHLNPWLSVYKTTDAMATAPTDYSNAAQDLSAAAAGVVLNSLNTLANNNFLLVGGHLPFRGVLVDVNGANAVAATLAVKYWNGAWTNITPTDGSASAGATFGQDGNVTWTVPTDWTPVALSTVYTSAPYFQWRDTPLFWTRWDVSAQLTNPTTLDRMLAMNRNTTLYNELLPGQPFETRILHAQPGGIGNIEALTDAGTANLIVNAFASREGGRFV